MFSSASRLFPFSILLIAAACSLEGPSSPGADRFAGEFALASIPHDVDLGACQHLAAPEGTVVSARYYAVGTQNYRWNGASWAFTGPTADLFVDAKLSTRVGTHFSGPRWVSTSGSGVHGALVDKCPVDPNSIPWLLLAAQSSWGPGIFSGTTHIQRLNTVGGNAPSTPGITVGEEARVPYTADYVFYRMP